MSSGGTAASSLMPILLLVIIGVAIYSIYKRKKNNREANPFLSNRKNKDEVWKTIKQFLKDNNCQGKELADSYVVKRNHVDYVDPNSSELAKRNKTYELKIRQWQYKQAKKYARSSGTYVSEKNPARDLFVVVFKTRDTKTHKEDPYRCFECEVLNTKIGKKQYDRKIIINGELDLDKEMEWIAPIRAAEQEKAKAMEAKAAKRKANQDKVEKKKRLREEKRARRHAKK